MVKMVKVLQRNGKLPEAGRLQKALWKIGLDQLIEMFSKLKWNRLKCTYIEFLAKPCDFFYFSWINCFVRM